MSNDKRLSGKRPNLGLGISQRDTRKSLIIRVKRSREVSPEWQYLAAYVRVIYEVYALKVRPNKQANWGSPFALPHMHQAQLGLLPDLPRKGARQKSVQTAFGRLVAIKYVWCFRPAIGGLARVFNCDRNTPKNNPNRDDSVFDALLPCLARRSFAQ